MFPIRQKELVCTNKEKINLFLRTANTGFLGLADAHLPYVVPLNYVWTEQSETIYFHGAEDGRKISILAQNPHACFTVCENFGTMTDPVPAKTDTAYMSVMIFGTAEKVTNPEETIQAMQQLLNKYVPGYYERPLSSSHVEKYRSPLGSSTAVFKIKMEEMSAKENHVHQNKLFYPGKKADHDF